MADPTDKTNTPATPAPGETKPQAEAKPVKLVTLVLSKPYGGFPAGRVVKAAETLAERLTKTGKAAEATPAQIGLAGGRVPTLAA